jgi:ParB/RepB/Spo0J family partition protein
LAKRKRLTPAQPDYLETGGPAPETKSRFPLGVARTVTRAPIADVAGAAAATAALEEVTGELRAARAGGRLVQALPLDAVDAAYLVRDRLDHDPEALEALLASIRARGQQTPIEAVELEPGRFGLISGWRRLSALKRLHVETGEDRFARVQALLRRPETAEDAYLAMVEENEIRAGLSYYERARIVARAAELHVFPDEQAALRRLFASASRARRSKIGSFLPLYHALDARLRFPAAIPERLGLKLSKALTGTPELGPRLAERLRKAAAAETYDAGAELAVLTRALAADPAPEPAAAPPAPPAIRIERLAEGCRLTGPGVDALFLQRLQRWLDAGMGL